LEPGCRTSAAAGGSIRAFAVAVEWTDAEQSLRAEGYTVDIGAKAAVAASIRVGQKLRLINLTNQISLRGRVGLERARKPAQAGNSAGVAGALS